MAKDTVREQVLLETWNDAWRNKVDDNFEKKSAAFIRNDNPSNARYLMIKMMEKNPGEVFMLSSTRLCHTPERRDEWDVYDNPDFIQQAKRFIENKGTIRIVCFDTPLHSKFLSEMRQLSDEESSRFDIKVRNSDDESRSQWHDFSVCGESFRFELDDEADDQKKNNVHAIASAKGTAELLNDLTERFDYYWKKSSAYIGQGE